MNSPAGISAIGTSSGPAEGVGEVEEGVGVPGVAEGTGREVAVTVGPVTVGKITSVVGEVGRGVVGSTGVACWLIGVDVWLSQPFRAMIASAAALLKMIHCFVLNGVFIGYCSLRLIVLLLIL